MKKSDLVFIFFSFFTWRVGILIIALLSIKFLPLFSHNYLGAGFSNYQTSPLFWGHLNFDGEHYLAIAQDGYRPLEYFFFPLFPYLIKILSSSTSQTTLAHTGLLLSNISFLLALIGIYKLIKIDYKENVARLILVIFLAFPTSFYFAVFYSESLFLMLIVWSFYCARKHNFLVAGTLAAFASATRIIGAVMFFVLIIEFLKQKDFKKILGVLISPLGVIFYMYYLYQKTHDPLIFLHQVSIYGEQRSSAFIFFPQVIYRYVFKILPFVSYHYFPNIFITYLEFIISILFFCLIIFGFFRLRLSYFIYSLFAFLIPTLAGSFSSMPRYVIVIFPVFILIGVLLNRIPKVYTYIVFSVMILLLVIAGSLFWRGYWIS